MFVCQIPCYSYHSRCCQQWGGAGGSPRNILGHLYNDASSDSPNVCVKISSHCVKLRKNYLKSSAQGYYCCHDTGISLIYQHFLRPKAKKTHAILFRYLILTNTRKNLFVLLCYNRSELVHFSRDPNTSWRIGRVVIFPQCNLNVC